MVERGDGSSYIGPTRSRSNGVCLGLFSCVVEATVSFFHISIARRVWDANDCGDPSKEVLAGECDHFMNR